MKTIKSEQSIGICPKCGFQRLWYEQDGIIYFNLISEGTSGPEWREYFKKKGIYLRQEVRSILSSPDFKPTTGVVYHIAVIKGVLFRKEDRGTEEICTRAERRKYTKTNVEVACLIRKFFSDKDLKCMNLEGIIIVHNRIKVGGSDNFFLYVAQDGGDGRELVVYYDHYTSRWDEQIGFSFIISQDIPEIK